MESSGAVATAKRLVNDIVEDVRAKLKLRMECSMGVLANYKDWVT